ncbi:hypothetical protein [Paracoccus versutus]|uniref:hypothetical protein n=1 Tax=Paracoccus versutus TaxID=34007 RepID=UPI00068A5C35|nr:hypothetical protein [Paracoccus versutus]
MAFYYHFRSKDDLIAAWLEMRDQPNLAAFPHWFARAKGDLADKVQVIFDNLARSARRRAWKGCGFGHMLGHGLPQRFLGRKMSKQRSLRLTPIADATAPVVTRSGPIPSAKSRTAATISALRSSADLRTRHLFS